jgi:hypothetical protein
MTEQLYIELPTISTDTSFNSDTSVIYDYTTNVGGSATGQVPSTSGDFITAGSSINILSGLYAQNGSYQGIFTEPITIDVEFGADLSEIMYINNGMTILEITKSDVGLQKAFHPISETSTSARFVIDLQEMFVEGDVNSLDNEGDYNFKIFVRFTAGDADDSDGGSGESGGDDADAGSIL